MSVLRRSATGAVAAFAVVLAAPALSASAAPRHHHFETLASVSGGKVQACRIPTSASKPVQIKLRVDATKAHGYMWIDKDELSGAIYKGMVASGLKTVPVDDVLDLSLLQEIKEGK